MVQIRNLFCEMFPHIAPVEHTDKMYEIRLGKSGNFTTAFLCQIDDSTRHNLILQVITKKNVHHIKLM